MTDDTMTGRLVSVDRVPYGDALSAAASAGATTLYVDDAVDFDEDGGYLRINGEVIAYLSADLDLDTITLATPLSASAEDGTLVEVWDLIVSDVASELVAQVVDEGENFADDTLEAIVDNPVAPLVPLGIRGSAGEGVIMQYRGETLFVIAVLGREPVAQGFVNDDTAVWSGTGTPTVALSRVPIAGSLLIRQNGTVLSPAVVAYDSQTNTVTVDTTAVVCRGGDTFIAYYAYNVYDTYDDTTFIPTDPDPGATLITPSNAVTLNSSFSWGGVVDGAPPQWGDSLAATGATMYIRYGTAVVNKRQVGSTTFPAQPGLVVNPSARVAVWYTVTGSDLEYGFDVLMQPDALSSVKLQASPTGANGLTAPAGWNVVEMLAVSGTSIGAFLTAWQTTPEELEILPNWPTGAEPSGTVTKHIGIGEIRVAIYYP